MCFDSFIKKILVKEDTNTYRQSKSQNNNTMKDIQRCWK